MVKMKKMMLVVAMIVIVCLLMAMNFEVKAASGTPGTSDNPIDISGDIDLPLNDLENEQPNATGNEAENGVGNTLPKTGVTEDITVMFFTVVCVVSAVYAYKKIRDYNV